MSERPRIAKQGSADGLCGVYCLINFLHARAEVEQREAFRYVFEAAEQCNLLNAHFLHDGFEARNLITIFNQVANNLRLKFFATHLADVAVALKKGKFAKIARTVTGDGGEIIMSVASGRHWVLLHGIDDTQFYVDDPDAASTQNGKFSRQGRSVPTDDGVVILPRTKEILERGQK
jgi:hypothetical protein